MDDPDVMERELNELGRLFAERFNKIADAIEKGKYYDYKQLPTLKDLDTLEEFGRAFTTKAEFKQVPAPDRANLAEVRCVISDAVLYARALDYDRARESMDAALRKLMRVRDRKRTKALPPEVEDALLDAAAMLVDVISMFDAAEQAFAEGVHDDAASHAR